MNVTKLLAVSIAAITLTAKTDWVYYPAGHAMNPHPAGTEYPVITNGNWVLNVEPLTSVAANALKLGCSDAAKASLYGNVSRGIAFSGIGSGVLDLRGTIRHVDSSSTTYYLHSFGYMALAASNEGTHKQRTGTMTICYTPGTLRQFGGQDFNSQYKIIQRIYVDEPHVTGKYSGSWNFPDNLKHLELNLPGVTEISGANVINNIYQDAPYTNSFDQWSLTGVTNIATKAFCQIGKMSGTLSLPSLVNAGDYAFTNSSFTAIVFGKPGVTTTFGTSAFDGCVAMREMVIRGNPPTSLSGTWGSNNRAARTMVFSIPLDEAVWKEFLDGKILRSVGTEEAVAFMTANPGVHATPAYVVAASAFGTANEQYVAGIAGVTCDYDAFFGDTVDVESADRAKIADGEYPKGTTITLFASTGSAAGARFAGWYGDVDGAEIVTDPSGGWSRITFTIAKRTWLFARFTHPWTYNSTAGTVSNGKWTLNTTSGSTGKLMLGNGKPTGLFTAGANNGVTGVLDLGGNVSDGVDDYEFSQISAVNGTCCASNQTAVTGNPTVFISPGSCSNFSGGQLFNSGIKGCYWTYETIIIDEPSATGNIPNWYLSKQSKCRRFILRAPKLDEIGRMGVFGTDGDKAPLDLTDLGWWRLDSISTIKEGTFLQNYSRNAGDTFFGISAYGTLCLPACTSISENAFRCMPNLSGIVLGGASRRTKVVSIGAKALAGCPSLKDLTLHCDSSLGVDDDAFVGTSLESLRFLGNAPSAVALSAITAGVSATGPDARKCRIYASKRYGGWAVGGSVVSAVDVTETANAPDGVFGVWRDCESIPLGKTWVVDWKPPYDPPGFVISFQ